MGLRRVVQTGTETRRGRAIFDETMLKQMLTRLEFIILAASKLGKKWGESGNTYGVIGSDLFTNELSEFEQGKSIDNLFEKGGASLGTYVMPARAFGILGNGSESDVIPVRITPTGKRLHSAINISIKGNPAADWVINGGLLDYSMAKSVVQSFSVNGLPASHEERTLLESAFFEPYDQDPEVVSRYERFNKTVFWSLDMISKGCRSSQDIIHRTNNLVTSTDTQSAKDVELLWTEYDLRRQVHFAAELMLSALTRTLNYLNKADLQKIVHTWSEDYETTEFISVLVKAGQNPYHFSLEDFVSRIKFDNYDKSPPPCAFSQRLATIRKSCLCVGNFLVLPTKIGNPAENGTHTRPPTLHGKIL